MVTQHGHAVRLLVRRLARVALCLFGALATFGPACPAAERPMPAPTTKPSPVVFGYVPTWRDDKAAPELTDFTAYTHLARAFLRPRPDGTLLVETNYFDSAFEKAARARGVKLLMAIGGSAKKPDPWTALAESPPATRTFLDTLARLYDEHGYDGVDIDWEPAPQTDAGGHDYAALIRKIRDRFPEKLLTITVSGKDYALRHLPLGDVLPKVDYVNAMFYDYNASWTGVAGFASNLNPDAAPDAGSPFSVNTGLGILLNDYHVPPAKLVGGVTFWGYRFRVDRLGETFPKNAPGHADSIEYARVLDLLGTGKYAAKRSESAGADYVVRNDGGCVITYETPASIRDKCVRYQQLGLAGVMVWHANADTGGGRTPLLSAIVEAYGRPPLPLSETALRGEVERFRGKPTMPGETAEQLLASDRELRARRAEAEDARWAAGPTNRPAD